MVFLILAAQYENWSLPLSVLLALPFGTFGALAAIWINNLLPSAPASPRAATNDVYFQIGLVTLLGLAAKNAILIVEYAVMKNHEGLSASAAAVEAARLRFRPDPDDLARLHPRRAAARVLERRRRRRAPLGRHRRDGRHARGDLPRDLLRADVLQADHRPAPHGEARQRRDQATRRSRRACSRTGRCRRRTTRRAGAMRTARRPAARSPAASARRPGRAHRRRRGRSPARRGAIRSGRWRRAR